MKPDDPTRRDCLQRYFGSWGLMGFASVTGALWQYVLSTFIWSLPNGGPSGALYMVIVCAVGLMLNILSLAELASMSGPPHPQDDVLPDG